MSSLLPEIDTSAPGTENRRARLVDRSPGSDNDNPRIDYPWSRATTQSGPPRTTAALIQVAPENASASPASGTVRAARAGSRSRAARTVTSS